MSVKGELMQKKTRLLLMTALFLVSPLLPMQILGLEIGPSLPFPDPVTLAIPPISMGVLMLWALISIRKNATMPARERRKWILLTLFLGYVGASVVLLKLWMNPHRCQEKRS